MLSVRHLTVIALAFAFVGCARAPMQERAAAHAAIEAAEAAQLDANAAAHYHMARARYHMDAAEQALARTDHFMTCVHSVRAKAHADLVMKGGTLEQIDPDSEALNAHCYQKSVWKTLTEYSGS